MTEKKTRQSKFGLSRSRVGGYAGFVARDLKGLHAIRICGMRGKGRVSEPRIICMSRYPATEIRWPGLVFQLAVRQFTPSSPRW